MKSVLVLILTVFTSQSFAWKSTSANEKDYNFRFKFNGENLVLQQKGDTYEEAYERAAKSCFAHFKGNQKLNEQRGLDIIDVCANPRS